MKKKRCGTCKQMKSLNEFHNNKCKPDGKDTKCKACKSEYDKMRRDGLIIPDMRSANRIPSIERKYHCITCGMGHDTEREAALCCDYKAKL